MIRNRLKTNAIKCEKCKEVATYECRMSSGEILHLCDQHAGLTSGPKVQANAKYERQQGWNPQGIVNRTWKPGE